MVDGNPAARGSRVALPYAAPLPRISQQYGGSDGDEKYEVVIVGVRLSLLLPISSMFVF